MDQLEHQGLERPCEHKVERELHADGQVVLGLLLELGPDGDSADEALHSCCSGEDHLEELAACTELDHVDLFLGHVTLELISLELVLAVNGPVRVALVLLLEELLEDLDDRLLGGHVQDAEQQEPDHPDEGDNAEVEPHLDLPDASVHLSVEHVPEELLQHELEGY